MGPVINFKTAFLLNIIKPMKICQSYSLLNFKLNVQLDKFFTYHFNIPCGSIH